MRAQNRHTSRFAAVAVSAVAAACGGDAGPAPTFHAADNPAVLSDWGMLAVKAGALAPAAGVLPYDLNTPLFSDYAGKFRTIWMPPGTAARYAGDQALDFPVGTVITKTFYYRAGEDGVLPSDGPTTAETLDLAGVRLIETRILTRRETGWTALPYVWNADQTEATLKRTGEIVPLTLVRETGAEPFSYLVPNANQCAGCHATNNTTREIHPIGPVPRRINLDFPYADGPAGQLETLAAMGYLEGLPDDRPRDAAWTDENVSVAERARVYLDVNCAHCHSRVGPADTSGLFFEPDTAHGPHLGLCKTPVAAGGGTGGRPYDITPGDPDRSIIVHRMETGDPGAMMPELGRAVTHTEGVALVKAWIEEMEGSCS